MKDQKEMTVSVNSGQTDSQYSTSETQTKHATGTTVDDVDPGTPFTEPIVRP